MTICPAVPGSGSAAPVTPIGSWSSLVATNAPCGARSAGVRSLTRSRFPPGDASCRVAFMCQPSSELMSRRLLHSIASCTAPIEVDAALMASSTSAMSLSGGSRRARPPALERRGLRVGALRRPVGRSTRDWSVPTTSNRIIGTTARVREPVVQSLAPRASARGGLEPSINARRPRVRRRFRCSAAFQRNVALDCPGDTMSVTSDAAHVRDDVAERGLLQPNLGLTPWRRQRSCRYVRTMWPMDSIDVIRRGRLAHPPRAVRDEVHDKVRRAASSTCAWTWR